MNNFKRLSKKKLLLTAVFLIATVTSINAQITQKKLPARVETTVTNAIIKPFTKIPPPSSAPSMVDLDKDGIDDNVEKKLLERFRPYYKFSYDRNSQENYRPTDVIFYIEHSELNKEHDQGGATIITNKELASMPYLLLLQKYKSSEAPPIRPNGNPVIKENPSRTNYYINPLEHVDGDNTEEPGRHGNSWEEELSKKNIGLYGHVVPIKLSRPQDFDRKKVLTGNDVGNLYYKIEYWQFFGFNEDGIVGGLGNHEGDWTTVQLLYNPATDKIEAVFHYAHGKVEFRFFINEATSTQDFVTPPQQQPVELYKEYRGRNYKKYSDIVSLIDNYSHNSVRFLQDPVTKEYSHPFVYIEWGAHEFWPYDYGFYPDVPNHNGKGYSFLTNTPPNLGEVENSLPQTEPAYSFDEIILQYSGYWGTKGGPPPGPILHYQWTWPASSSIRWQLKGKDLTD